MMALQAKREKVAQKYNGLRKIASSIVERKVMPFKKSPKEISSVTPFIVVFYSPLFFGVKKCEYIVFNEQPMKSAQIVRTINSLFIPHLRNLSEIIISVLIVIVNGALCNPRADIKKPPIRRFFNSRVA
jgi:hypothetical protein